MKSIIYFFILGCLLKVNVLSAQGTINYFDQEPPGDSAVVFSPDFISTNDRFVQSSRFSMDGSEFCFVQTNSNWDSFKIKYTNYETDHWTDPVDLYFLGENIDKNSNLGPCFSPDSSRFYLLESFKNIWYSDRDGAVWSEPTKIPSPISSSQRRGEPSASNRNTLFFAENGRIRYSEFQDNGYPEIRSLENPVNTTSSNNDIDPFISPDEDYLIFSSNRTGIYGEFDLYISYKKPDGRWTNPKNLGPKINTEEWECVPAVTPDGKYLLFTRRETWITSIPSKIYWVSSSFIDSLKLTNYDPYVLNEIPNQTVTLGDSYSYVIPDTIFFDDDENDTLIYSVKLKNGDDLPGWLDFDPEALSISGTPAVAEKLSIRITVSDSAGKSTSDDFSLTIQESTLSENISYKEFSIYPVPADEFLSVKFENTVTGDVKYLLMDALGKTIKTGILNDGDIIDVSGLNKGFYFLNVMFNEYNLIRNVIIE